MAEQAKVFIVEMNDEIRNALHSLFAKRGCIVASSSNGMEALEKLRSMAKPSVFIVGQSNLSPGGDESITTLLLNEKFSTIPVLKTSAKDTQQTKSACLVSRSARLRSATRTPAILMNSRE